MLVGCHQEPAASTSQAPASGPAKVRIGYLGLTCEAAMFVAYENGFFKDEGWTSSS